MGNNVAAGHVLAATGLPQAAGFHKTLGQMMYHYNIQPWDPKELLQESLQRQQELQRSSPLRFIQVDEGLRFYGSQVGGVIHILSRERFVEMSLRLFKQKGLHLPVEEAKLFYDIFDSIDIYMNAQLSIGELAGGLSSFFGGTSEAKSSAIFDLLAGGRDQLAMSSLKEFLKPYIWCMVPPDAAVLRPLLLSHVVQEIYNDMSSSTSGYITQLQFQRWLYKGQLSQAQVSPNHTSVSFTIIDRAAISINFALRLAWQEYEQKYQLREYGQQTWQQHYGSRRQYLQDVGVRRYVAQATPTVTTGANSVVASVGHAGSWVFQSASQGVAHISSWLSDANEDEDEEYSSTSTSTRRVSAESVANTTTATEALPPFPASSPGVALPQPADPIVDAQSVPPTASVQLATPEQTKVLPPNLFANIGTMPTGTAPPTLLQSRYALSSHKHQASLSVTALGASPCVAGPWMGSTFSGAQALKQPMCAVRS